MSDHQLILRYLDNDFTRPVRDPLWKNIYLSPALEKVLQIPAFVRLSRVKQLGLAFQVYPGATHTRMAHSLGVFHLAKKIISTLLRAPGCPSLTLEGVKAFLASALFHDLGHFPYAHVLEDGLEVKNHEVLTGEHILNTELKTILEKDLGADPLFCAAIVSHDLEPTGNAQELGFYRRLLSGVLDPDKLDYLNRDAYFCGIPYGTQDTDFILSQILPHDEKGICLGSKGIMAVESLLFSKYLMYKSVYWHKGVRSPSAVIKKALYMGLTQGVIAPEDLYHEDDQSLSLKLSAMDFPPFRQILKAQIPGSFRTLYEEPYDEHSLFSQRLRTTKDRHALEDDIRRNLEAETGLSLGPEEVTIDIPHSVSFEVDLPIASRTGYHSFVESGTVFEQSVVRGFTTHLKKLRLIGPRRLEGLVKDPGRLLRT